MDDFDQIGGKEVLTHLEVRSPWRQELRVSSSNRIILRGYPSLISGKGTYMKRVTCTTISFILLSLMVPAAGSTQTLQLYAAGSLKAALNETAAAFEKTYQTKVNATFGPSGVLKDSHPGW